ncbi:MAG: amidohydrolase [Candidatus Cloacimonetes bacterium]|jgi:N-acetyldiaminopimelate deacetylase|nr:amidohydrolase [Candidatus Cloacimonadota bacterium]MDD2506951.1 amidohydrolase [Candidatus Cloacimonadota bacterium]MDD4147463.1 amidohydrolase [Candidatus Cloacimonadota bacterium]MDD4560576.1 amidohydrolase [Candidatus Cloacimonadota bacterium]
MLDPIHIRHHLHQIPELAYDEYKTKAFLMQQLQELITPGSLFRILEFKNSNGILVEYNNGKTQDNYKLFRADMDALPTIEKSGCSFASIHPGLMHACGHDVHMAVLMALIQKVQQYHPAQNLLFLFQPAEEGHGGAESIINENILQGYDIRAAFALHVGSDLPVGTISSKSGIFFGIPQEFDLRFVGKASHVAFPEKGINALAAGMHFYEELLKEIPDLSREERVIFHVGKMSAGQVRNIIADECLMEGTHRTLSKAMRDRLNTLIQKHAQAAADAIGAQTELRLLGTYDPVVNNAELESNLREICNQMDYSYLPAETVMTGEDFGFFSSMYPALLFWLGSGSDMPLHSGYFLPDDDCIEVGANVMWGLLQS